MATIHSNFFSLRCVRRACLLIIFSLSFSFFASAPAAARPLGSKEAVRGGNFTIRYGEEPPTLNPLLPPTDDSWITAFLLESLLYKNPETYEWEPLLAESFKISDEGKTFDFTLRKNARWSDGKPVTARDIEFSYQLNFDARYPAAERRAALENVKSLEVIDDHHVRFHVAAGSFLNFRTVASLKILPRHIFRIPDEGETPGLRAHPLQIQYPIGSGPYRFDNWAAGRSLTLVRNPRWWGWQDPENLGKFNPYRLTFRFVGADHLAYEMLKRGDLDYINLTPEQYLKALDNYSPSMPFVLQKVTNSFPTFMNSLVFNLRKPLFQDARVRRALVAMIDRPTIQRTFFRGLSDLAVGPWYNESVFADPAVRPITYDRAASISLLSQAGWEKAPEERFFFRRINGKKEFLKFTILTSNRVALRHLTFIKEDAARAGVDIEIKLVDRTTFTQSLDARTFEVVDYGWGSPVEFEPSPAWACSQAKEGLNISGFCDPRVDELAAKAASTFSIDARIPYLREMYRRVAEAVPQIFLLNENSTYYAVSRRVGRSRNFFKYDAGVPYMWIEKGRRSP
ncbi:MAG: hypothetical protein EOP11_04890 [Proteobacteria bacterium]|nr:MAG: hypothetical protein EOP11_04890 [Pseudomonadota bacterium]